MRISDLNYKPKIKITGSTGFSKILKDDNLKSIPLRNLEYNLEYSLNHKSDYKPDYKSIRNAAVTLRQIPTSEKSEAITLINANKHNIVIGLIKSLQENDRETTESTLDSINRFINFGINWYEFNIIVKSANYELRNQLAEDGVGKIVKGVNTTNDVKPGEIKRQSAKMGFKTSNNGCPPIINSNGKFNQIKSKKLVRSDPLTS